jgi:uncharacterized cupredoxin-like copper-binding protein
MRKLGLMIVALVAAGALAGSAPAKTVVNVKENEFKLLLSTRTAKAGVVVFVVKNTGKLEHSFVVIKTNRAPGKLPQKGNVAVETGRVGKIASIKPGVTKRLTLTLKAGKYVLICNMPLHYKAGQYAGFTVT